ncbi:MAG: penicillin-binding protein [Clostridia bacterium]|nr:penicillin-binding protein [Clostridia bacterium]
MRSNKNKKKVAMNRRSEEPRRPQRERYERDTLEELRARSRVERGPESMARGPRRPVKGKPKKSMNDKMRRRNRRRNKIIMILYTILSIYIIFSYFKWRSLILPMMKNENSIIVDQNGTLLETIGAERKKDNVSLSQIPDNMKNAYIDIEDERFYKHKGVDVKRTVGAIGTYVTHFGKSSFGGSTITQQLVKNLTGNDDTKINRKIEEWYRAYEIESFCSKDEILEAYFNIIYVGPNTYGVSAGAKYYFDKDVSELDLAECAYMAGINNSPNSYNPFGSKDNSDRIKTRTKVVLKKMLSLNHISQEEYNKAVLEVDEGLHFKNGTIEAESDGVYSYHADALISEVVDDIAKRKHIDTRFAKNYVYMAGLKIYSTENAEIQDKIENEYEKEKYSLTSSSGNKAQSAMVVIDHTNGHVLGCVGGLGKKTTARGFNRVTQGYRQTGSASKPLAVLLPGIAEKTFTASTMYVDEPTTFNDGTPDGYSPTDNENYIGNITVRRAVESSQNIPFVKMMEQITPKKSIKYLKKMGITSLQKEDESLMLALGGLKKGITPLEMAGAYATIANDGVYIEPTFYTKIENNKGKVVFKSKQKKRKVCSQEVAYVLKQLLKQPVEGDEGTARSCKIDGMDVAAKTGTTNSNYDKWLCGFTTYYTAVTWYGYDIAETIEFSGKSPAVQLWSSVMRNIHSGLPRTQFAQNNKVVRATICQKTGKVSNGNCPDCHTEYFLPGTVPDQCTTCTSGSRSSSSTKKKTTSTNTSKNTTNTTNTTNTDTSNSSTKNETNTNKKNEDDDNTSKNKNTDNDDDDNNNSNNQNNNDEEEEDDDDHDEGP